MKSIDELASVGRGKSRHRPRNEPSLYGGEHPFVQTADIHQADLTITTYSQTYSDKGLEQSKLWEPGVICITNAGENTGDCAILGIRACFPDSIIGVIAEEKKSDTVFLKYAIDQLKPQLRQVTRGATQDNLSLAKLLAFKFPTPPPKTQRRIGEVLGNYGALIENNRRRIELLERAARMLYQEWFVSLRFPGHEHTRVTNGTPQGWERKTAHDALEILSGGTPKTAVAEFWGGEIPFYTPKDAPDGVWVTDCERTITDIGLSNCNSRLFPKETVFISARGTVGKLNMAQRPMAMSQSCYALVGKAHLTQPFVFCAMQEGAEALRQQAVGAVFDAIIMDTFKRISFLVPQPKTVRLFDEFARPVLAQLENLTLQNQKLRAARDLLLPRLMSGEIQP